MKTVIEMAREARAAQLQAGQWLMGHTELERLVALVRADEREACAAIAEDVGTATEPDDFALDKCYEIENAIRARSNK